MINDSSGFTIRHTYAGNSNVLTEALAYGINGSLRRREVQAQNPFTEYCLFNSAGNLKAYSDNGLYFAYYGYDAANTRTYKLSMLNQCQLVNGQPQPLDLQLQSATFYPNQYLTFDQDGRYTKHYYAGTQRIASRLGESTHGISCGYGDFPAAVRDFLEQRSMHLQEIFNSQLSELITLEPGRALPVEMETFGISSLETTAGDLAVDIYYYSVNHLGSTAFTTDGSCSVTQGFVYAPFGEIVAEYQGIAATAALPKYAFNAKELDEESGMYCYLAALGFLLFAQQRQTRSSLCSLIRRFEARYYAPPTFTSRDPLFEKYFWLSPYTYCANNPMKFVDPTGCDIYPSKSFNESKYGNIYKNLRTIDVYNDLIEPFKQQNIDLQLSVTGKLKYLGKTDRCSPVIQRDVNGKIEGMCVKTDFGKEQSEIGCVKTLLHEAVHANRLYREVDDFQSHTGFDRMSILNGLKEYNEKFMNSHYTDEQLEVISWVGLMNSAEFDVFITFSYSKKGENKEQATERFVNEYKSLIYDNKQE